MKELDLQWNDDKTFSRMKKSRLNICTWNRSWWKLSFRSLDFSFFFFLTCSVPNHTGTSEKHTHTQSRRMQPANTHLQPGDLAKPSVCSKCCVVFGSVCQLSSCVYLKPAYYWLTTARFARRNYSVCQWNKSVAEWEFRMEVGGSDESFSKSCLVLWTRFLPPSHQVSHSLLYSDGRPHIMVGDGIVALTHCSFIPAMLLATRFGNFHQHQALHPSETLTHVFCCQILQQFFFFFFFPKGTRKVFVGPHAF